VELGNMLISCLC